MVKVSVSPEITHESVAAHLKENVQGTPVPFNDETLSAMSDVAKIKKVYKLGALPTPVANNQAYDNDKRRLEVAMLGAIALRGS